MEALLNRLHAMTLKDWAIDIAVAAAAFAIACGQLMLTVSSIIFPDLALRQYLGLVDVRPDFAAFVCLALTTFPLVVRRIVPWTTAVFVLVVYCASQTLFSSYTLFPIGVVVALFTLAATRPLPETIGAAALSVAGLVLFPASSVTPTLAFYVQVQNLCLIVAGAAAGYGYQTHRACVVATEQRAAEAERTREEEAARRVEEERVRIAGEVHDITAHSLSAVSIQTAAAERLIDRDPQAAKEAIAAARSTAKGALDDIRSMIGVLRHGDNVAEKAPSAGTDRLPDLKLYLQQAGIECTVDTSSYMRSDVPAHVDLALFAISREAATNMVRHAHATQAAFVLTTRQSDARLIITDNGTGSGAPFRCDSFPTAQDGEGNGMLSMAQRAQVLGGTFAAGDAPQGGFRIEVRIPFTVLNKNLGSDPIFSSVEKEDGLDAPCR